jgi:hypothetical protein
MTTKSPSPALDMPPIAWPNPLGGRMVYLREQVTTDPNLPSLEWLARALNLSPDAPEEVVKSTVLKRLANENERVERAEAQHHYTMVEWGRARKTLEKVLAHLNERIAMVKVCHDELGTKEFDRLMAMNNLPTWRSNR